MKKILLCVLGVLVINLALVLLFTLTPAPDNVQPVDNTLPEKQAAVVVPPETQLGQLFMIGHWADTPVASTTALIQKYQLGGVIIMSAPEDTQNILTWTAQWNAVSERPLLIAIDQEGGPVTRLKGEAFTQTGQRDIDTAEQAYEVGLARGEELARLGINMNFAPVLDTAKNPTSFMYSRTFPTGTNAALLAASMIKGLAASQVTAVVKHFPGHDDTRTDSHTELPVVNISETELSNFTQPFANIIRENSPRAIMTAHVQFPEIDPLPATLSKFFLTTYLRQQLGYNGLIITDDMSMDAIDTQRSPSEASVLALEAGADIILLAAEPADIEIILPFIITQMSTSILLRDRVADSFNRVIEAKDSTTISPSL